MRTFLVSIVGSPSAQAVFPDTPVRPIPVAKVNKREVSIVGNKNLAKLLKKALRDDPQMVP